MSRQEFGDSSFDAADLLSIDVESELRKLSQAQFQGTWQLPAELVRTAAASGATLVEVEISRNDLRVRHDGASVPLRVLQAVAHLLDRREKQEHRHKALLSLESASDRAWLGVIGSQAQRIQILTATMVRPPHRHALLDAQAKQVELRAYSGSEDRRTTITLSGIRIDRQRARRWLEEACRFAQLEVRLQGQRIVAGEGADNPAWLGEMRVEHPLPARIGVPKNGDNARIWLLRSGVILTHLSMPEAPCFEAAVEIGGLGEGKELQDLRELVTPHLPALSEQAMALLFRLGQRCPQLSPTLRTRVSRLLFSAARHRHYAEKIAQLPLFRGVEASGRPRDFDLVTLRSLVSERGGDRTLVAIFPEQKLESFTLSSPVFILDDSERSWLSDTLSLRFTPPPRRVDSPPHGSLGQRMAESFWQTIDRVRPVGTPVTPANQSPAERNALAGLQPHFPNLELVISEGNGPIVRRPNRLILPRQNSEVRRCFHAIERDPKQVYAAAIVLSKGSRAPASAREAAASS